MRQVLSFVDDQNNGFAFAVAFKQPMIELKKLLALGLGLAGNIEFCQDEIEELARIHPGVEEESGARTAVMQPVEQAIDQGGLAGTDFAPKGNETFTCPNSLPPTCPPPPHLLPHK